MISAPVPHLQITYFLFDVPKGPAPMPLEVLQESSGSVSLVSVDRKHKVSARTSLREADAAQQVLKAWGGVGGYLSLAYSPLASRRMGMLGSASSTA